MLTVNNLNQYYGGSHILRDLSFTAEAGKVTAILGRNGVGKSTLLKSLMGLLPTRSGSIEFAGHDLTRSASHQRVRAGIGYVPQGREIFPRLTVQENLLMGLAACPGRTPVPERIFEMFPVLRQMLRGAAATFRAGSSSSWRSAGRWPWDRNC
jgi:urea transport system ATP-binding protein